MNIKRKLFQIRSYTPIPFLLIAIIFAKPTIQTLLVGFLISIVGEAIRFWGVSICGSETRTTEKVGATNLITDGPFGYVRNPLYVGNILIYSGATLMSNAFFPFFVIFTFIFFIIQYHLIVSLEEEHLKNIFSDEYKIYSENVSRFIPRFVKYSGSHSFHRKADFYRGLKSETRTLQAFLIIFTIFILKFLNYL